MTKPEEPRGSSGFISPAWAGRRIDSEAEAGAADVATVAQHATQSQEAPRVAAVHVRAGRGDAGVVAAVGTDVAVRAPVAVGVGVVVALSGVGGSSGGGSRESEARAGGQKEASEVHNRTSH